MPSGRDSLRRNRFAPDGLIISFGRTGLPSRVMRVFVSIERHDPFRVVALADVAAAWERNDRGYGCYGRGSLPYPGDRSLEITINLRVRPHHRLSAFPQFPSQLEQDGKLLYEGDDRLGLYAIARGRAGVLIAAGALQNELERSQYQALHFEKVCLTSKWVGVAPAERLDCRSIGAC